MGGGILVSVRFLLMIFNICTEWTTCLWKLSLFCFSIVLWCHLRRRAEFKCPVSLQACRSDLGVLKYLRKQYFSVLSPDLKHFCSGWLFHFAPEHRLLTTEVNVNQDWLLKARNKSKNLSKCKEPLCMVCSFLVNWLAFQTFFARRKISFFSSSEMNVLYSMKKLSCITEALGACHQCWVDLWQGEEKILRTVVDRID